MNKINYKLFGGVRFGLDEDGKVHIPRERYDFNYTDGDAVENDIWRIITQARDRSVFSQELVSGITDWPSEYHFSPRRVNILRPLTGLDSTTRVLELGCGCGAITRYLAEIGCHVDAVEGSTVRARIAAARVAEYQSARVFCSDFSHLSFESAYDVVTLIGVLEYAPRFFKTQDPIGKCLEIAAQAVKDDGILVVAIENQVGLNYFAGIGEDHHGKPYYGLEGQYGSVQTVTFGKHELTEILKAAGFSSVQFNYPFPDYKLPQAIITQAGIDSPDFNEADIVYERITRYDESKPFFDVASTCRVLSKNKLLGELANSFLVIAQKVANDRFLATNLLAEVYTDNRDPSYNTRTRFLETNGNVKVTKKKLTHDVPKSSLISLKLQDEQYVPGEILTTRIRELLKTGNPKEAFELLRRWVHLLETASSDGHLPADYLDAIPQNFVVTPDDRLVIFDKEWLLEESVELYTVVFRGIRALVMNNKLKSYLNGRDEKDRARLLCSELNIDVDFEQWWLKAETFNKELGKTVYDHGRWIISRDLRKPRYVLISRFKQLAKKILKKMKLI